MSYTASWQLRCLRSAGLLVVALLLALTAAFGTRTTAQATTDRTTQAAAATVHGCGYGYICLYEGYNYGGTIHRLYNCEYYYTPYYFRSVVNNQTTNTRANFYTRSSDGYVGTLIWTSRPALWYSGNVDGIAGGLGLRTYYVKPC